MDEPDFTPAATRLAASVVLVRRGPDGLEVFWVRRGAQLKFAGGFYAFAGGRVDAADGALPVSLRPGPGPANRASSGTLGGPPSVNRGGALSLPAHHRGALSDDERASIAAAARELFEETGVLAVPGAERISRAERDEARRGLTARPGKSSETSAKSSETSLAGAGGKSAPRAGQRDSQAGLFAALLERHGLRVEASWFHPAGRWITPPSVPTRFDTRFYLLELPAGETAEVWPGELADGEWITPARALLRWDDGTALLHPPAWHTLKSLERGELRDALFLLEDPARAPWKLPIADFIVERMEFQRAIVMVPLRTPTLFPATHTNCMLLGDDKLLVVDPGSPWAPQQAILSTALQRLEQDGRAAEAILLTHFHHDHVAGAMALSAEKGIPIWAHADTAARLAGEVRVDKLLDDEAPLAYGPRGFRALHLPGHTRGHLCLIEEKTGAVIAGDLVAGQSTVVIDPPEGDMRDYLASLDRLLALGPHALYPAHGQVIAEGESLLRQYVAHRLDRESKVLRALEALGPAQPAALVPHAYAEVAPALHPLAERSLLAHLLKLVKDGAARQREDGSFEIV